MRFFSWFLSILLHVVAAVLLIQAVRLAPPEAPECMELDLTRLERPEEAPLPVPAPLPAPAPAPLPAPAEQARPEPAPLPMDKTVVLDDAPPPPPAEAPAAVPQSWPEPGVAEISPVKVPRTEPLSKPVPPPASGPDPDAGKIIVRKDDTIVHRGHEARFGRSMMADYYSYSSSEFSGQFRTRDDRTISIIDARNTQYGRFLLYDSKHKTLRRLKEFGKYVYTIGPSAWEDEPVVGTITFLAKNDRIERFILTTDDDRLAHFPVKVHVREEEVRFPTNAGIRSGYVSLPPEGEKGRGVVAVHGNRCVEQGLLLGFTRTLSARGLASLSFEPRGCEDGSGTPESVETLVSDTRAALSHFGELAPVDFRKVGLWGYGPGVPVAVEAAHGGALSPAFLICVLDDALQVEAFPGKEILSRLDMPVFWLITGRDVSRWQGAVATLESLRDGGKRFTVVISPVRENFGTDGSAQAAWVERVTENHVRLAVSWLENLGL
ncbi:hypothetical protein GM415_06520 [Pseudodesulfovibrio cashew]|uniref:Alpha/beta hydrolase n=1 Tax=Pseudodesulfovibrio cashew TaxID=2678688 RepID=A0A6I6JF33_9BACT|nr:hypothetical protein [Pseudodesulfovibrio cashew]QGY39789.1 hypothetical protein GM415_06520 [Pseudodesulfovibrio cashew]